MPLSKFLNGSCPKNKNKTMHLQINRTLNLNIEVVENYMANLTDDRSTGEILKLDSEDCNVMAVNILTNSYICISYSNG